VSDDDRSTMTLVEHLDELRRRLIIVVGALVVTFGIGFAVSAEVIDLLRQPLPDQYATLIFTDPAGAFAARLKVALFVGLALAMPVLLFHVWRFVTPGLTSRERRVVWPLLLIAIALFGAGVGLGYFVLPYVLTFLLGFATASITPLLTIDGYIGFATTTMLAFGIALEFPILLVALARMGVIDADFLARRRRWAVLAIVVFAIVMTPGGDPFSPLIASAAMYLLFEASILVIRSVGGRRRRMPPEA
jgi:sec-independent protein translocase protein TatC